MSNSKTILVREVSTTPDPRLTAADVQAGQWICLQDEYSGGFGRFVKVEALDGEHVTLLTESDMDRWGGRIEGECIEESFPIFGWVQK